MTNEQIARLIDLDASLEVKLRRLEKLLSQPQQDYLFILNRLENILREDREARLPKPTQEEGDGE